MVLIMINEGSINLANQVQPLNLSYRYTVQGRIYKCGDPRAKHLLGLFLRFFFIAVEWTQMLFPNLFIFWQGVPIIANQFKITLKAL